MFLKQANLKHELFFFMIKQYARVELKCTAHTSSSSRCSCIYLVFFSSRSLTWPLRSLSSSTNKEINYKSIYMYLISHVYITLSLKCLKTFYFNIPMIMQIGTMQPELLYLYKCSHTLHQTELILHVHT